MDILERLDGDDTDETNDKEQQESEISVCYLSKEVQIKLTTMPLFFFKLKYGTPWSETFKVP